MGSKAGMLSPFTASIEGDYQMNKRAADQAEQDAIFNANQRIAEGVTLRKSQQASYSASGIELEGTAARVIEEDEISARIEAMNMIYAGKVAKAQMRHKARSERFQGYVGLAKDGASMAGGM